MEEPAKAFSLLRVGKICLYVCQSITMRFFFIFSKRLLTWFSFSGEHFFFEAPHFYMHTAIWPPKQLDQTNVSEIEWQIDIWLSLVGYFSNLINILYTLFVWRIIFWNEVCKLHKSTVVRYFVEIVISILCLNTVTFKPICSCPTRQSPR